MRALKVLVFFAAVFCAAGCSPKLDWREFRATDGGFTVLLPQKPGQAEHKLATPLGSIALKQYSVRIDQTVLAAGFADFPQPPDAGALDMMQGGLARSMNGKITAGKPLAAGNLTGREIVITGADGKAEMRARLYVRGKRYYQVVLAGSRGGFAQADADMFFDSFRVN